MLGGRGKNKLLKNISEISLYALLGGIGGALVSTLQHQGFYKEAFLAGFLHGLIIGFLLAIYIFIFKNWIRPSTRKVPSIFLITFNSLLFLLLILLGRAIGFAITDDSHAFNLIGNDTFFKSAVIFAFIFLLIINFFIHITPLFGQEAMFNFLFGRYRKYQKEDRMIMFLDINSSTKITEQIGDVKYLQLLDLFFYLMTEPLLESKGIIYKYVGDEAIITWKTKNAKAENGIHFFYDFKNLIQQKENIFLEKFGLVPTFSAGLHTGNVIVGEMGDVKKEIVMLGDALNATAHMLSFGKKENAYLTVSERLLDQQKIKTLSTYKFRDLGTHHLKGKEEKLRMFGVSKNSAE